MPRLKPIKEDTVIYARHDGWHYHLDRNCSMLQGGDFERLGYREIKKSDIKRLRPCLCAYENATIPHTFKGNVDFYDQV